MYYSSGNYEAFATPKKPEGVDHKSAYIIGSGLAALTAACYLVRDGQMKGEHVHVFEKDPIPGGACDGYKYDIGYVMRGGREMDNHFEVMWDLLRSIPSLETEGASVLDEYYWLNKEDPNYSLCRATVNRGEDAHTDGKFGLSDKGAMEIMKLFFTPNEQLQDKKITDFFDDEVLNSNFWLYWRTMFAFENWHSALEMKLYLKRYIHHIGGLPDFTALRFTRYNQYESIILPMVTYLKDHGVQFHYETKVVDVKFEINGKRKQASSVVVEHAGEISTIDLTENDLLFITNGGCVESCTMGAQDKAAGFDPTIKPGNGWDLWKKIAAQDPAFGNPEKFCSDPEHSNWESATITTLDDKIPQITLKARNKVAARVCEVAKEIGAELIVIGLPLNMDGTEGERAIKSRKLAKTVEIWSGLPVRMWDERQTTCAAADILDESGTFGTKRKEILDSVSATVILDDYLAWRKEHPGEI